MTVSENDLEILEGYLDDALEGNAAAQLASRLASDVELSAALTAIKEQRLARSAVWQSIDPDQIATDRLIWRVRGAMLDQQQYSARVGATMGPLSKGLWNPWRISSVGSAAAACLILGFIVGRVGQGGPASRYSPGLINTGGGNSTVAVDLHQPEKLAQGGFTRAGTVPQVLVPISNEYGQVVRWQAFDNAEQAGRFEEDLHRAQGQLISPPSAGSTKLASEEHF